MRDARKRPSVFVARPLTLVTMIALLSMPGLAFAATTVQLAPGEGAPQATGVASVELQGGTLTGQIRAQNLPAQPYGSGRFYAAWFVRSDTDDKAFLGALSQAGSIVLWRGGSGDMRFRATHFTAGPNAGSPISFGPAGTNNIVVLVENNINGLTPSPVGPVPGTGLALAGSF